MGRRPIEILRSASPAQEVPGDLEPLLTERIARAMAAWPNVSLGAERMVHAIAQRLSTTDAARDLDAMQTDDLYLACGCAGGDPAALDGFEQRCGPAIERAIASTGVPVAERADLGQIVRARLLVAPGDGGAPRIAAYSARSPLPAWVRVVATREAVRSLSRVRREVAADDDELAALVVGDDPELGYLKRLYRSELKHAFQLTIEALGHRDRLLLQQHLLDGLGIDQLAALHHVHRATVARWLQVARNTVVSGTQRALSQRLRLSRTELASVLHLIRSQLDLSLHRLLVGHREVAG